MKVDIYFSAFAILGLALLTSVSSSLVEDRVQQLETNLLSVISRLNRLERDSLFLKTEISDLKYEDGQNKLKIDQLTNENKLILKELAELKRGKEADREEIKRLNSQVESLRNGLVRVDEKLGQLDQLIQDLHSNCCGVDETSSWPTTTSQLVTTEPISDQIEYIDIDIPYSQVVPLKYKNYVATGYGNVGQIYDLRTKKLVQSLNDTLVANFKEFKENQIIQPSNNRLLIIWNLENGKLQQTLSGHSSLGVSSIALNKNQSLMLSGGYDNTIILWDMIEFKQIRTFVGHNGYIRSVIFNEAKDQVISDSIDYTIRIWNIHDASLVRTLTVDYGWVINKLLLDEETDVLYTASSDAKIKKWNIKTGSLLATLTSHYDIVYDIIFSEDKQRLISASYDRSIIIWDKHSHEIINQLNYTSVIFNLALNPLNGQLLSTTDDRKLLFWPLKP